jgi:hypothetical protein
VFHFETITANLFRPETAAVFSLHIVLKASFFPPIVFSDGENKAHEFFQEATKKHFRTFQFSDGSCDPPESLSR